MKKKSLGFKLVMGGLIIALIPMLAIGGFSIYQASRSLEKEVFIQCLVC